MNRDREASTPRDDICEPEVLGWDSLGQPYSPRFDQLYFPRISGLEDSYQSFIEGNQLPRRWAAWSSNKPFVIGELGFGTGLNFLLAWQHWRRLAPPHACLHFVAVEKYPLSRVDIGQALTLWPQLADLSQLLLGAYPTLPCRGFQRLVFDDGRVSLTLILNDALPGLQQLLPVAEPGPVTQAQNPTWAGAPILFDAWFLDGFAPSQNPDMWSLPLIQTMGQLSRDESTFAARANAQDVNDQLAAAGLVANDTGPSRGKIVCGTFGTAHLRPATLHPTRGSTFTPAWHTTPRDIEAQTQRDIIVIGGGLAGSHSARALADFGYNVTLLEKNLIASGASGNSQGVVYAKASSRNQPLTNFNLTALQFACRYYQTRTGYRDCGDACGVLHLAQTDAQSAEYRTLAARYQQAPEFARWIDQGQTLEASGIPLRHGGLLFPQAGWLDPGRLCRSLVQHANIRVKEQHRVAQLLWRDGVWQALAADGTELARAPRVVIANASDALKLTQCQHLPVKPIRGQVSEVAANSSSRPLARVICGEGYISPAQGDAHCLGASFNLHNPDSTPAATDDVGNLARVAQFSEALSDWTQTAASRVSFRCTTPDYLPLVGPAPIETDFLARFAGLRRNARRPVDAPGCYYPGLFINIGHGSRGLAYTPLCAELLAAMIAGAPLPLDRDMAMRLNPARFLLRRLKQNRN